MLFFPFFHGTLVADIEASPAQDAFALVDFVGNADVDAAFGAEEGTSAAGNTPVRNEIKLFYILCIHMIPPNSAA